MLGLRQIIAFRDALAHAYDIVDDRAVWSAVVVHLPGLRQAVADLLREVGAP